jgi:hypothetical protein
MHLKYVISIWGWGVFVQSLAHCKPKKEKEKL